MNEVPISDKSKGVFDHPFLLNAVFLVFLSLIIILRIKLLTSINFYVDSDQPFMWSGAADFAKGIFNEPRFYGQDYNTFMEALFAVPLIWMHVPVYYALPLATHFIFLFPYFFAAFYLLFNGKKVHAILLLAVLLCMTPAFDVLTSLPRGFVTGLFFCSFFVLGLAHPRNKSILFLNVVLLCLGYFVNPNSILVSLPFLFWIYLENYRDCNFYLVAGLACFSLVPFYYLFDKFYLDHPDHVIYGLRNSLSPDFFWQNLAHPEQAFGHINFFVEEQYLFLLLAFATLLLALYKKTKPGFLAFVAFLLLVLLSFFAGKTREGSFWPFYSYSRMYLGVPLLLCLFSFPFQFSAKKLIVVLVPITLLFTAYKLFNFNASVKYHTRENRAVGVHLVRLESVLDAIDFYGNVCKKNKTGRLLISNTFWLNTYLAYGGPAVHPDFPETEETRSERRYWVWKPNKKKVFSTFIFISARSDFDKINREQTGFECQRLDDYGLFLIKNNTLSNEEFISICKYLWRIRWARFFLNLDFLKGNSTNFSSRLFRSKTIP